MDIPHVFQFIIDQHLRNALQWYTMYTMYTYHILNMKMWHAFIASIFWYCLVQSVYHVTISVLNVIHTSPQFQMQRIEILYIVDCILRGIYCAEQFDIPCQLYLFIWWPPSLCVILQKGISANAVAAGAREQSTTSSKVTSCHQLPHDVTCYQV